MSIRHTLCFLTLPLFAGCQYLPHTNYFTAPENEPNPAWVRIPRHLDTHSTIIWTVVPRSLGQAVVAQRRRFVLLV